MFIVTSVIVCWATEMHEYNNGADRKRTETELANAACSASTYVVDERHSGTHTYIDSDSEANTIDAALLNTNTGCGRTREMDGISSEPQCACVRTRLCKYCTMLNLSNEQ